MWRGTTGLVGSDCCGIVGRMSLRTVAARHAPEPVRKIIHRIRAWRAVLTEPRARVAWRITRRTRMKVAAGPFTGLRYVSRHSWTWPVPNLVGSYESELHGEIERLIAERPHRVVNIGAAEGYYAVGLARRLTDATVYAFDVDPAAREICADMARLNGVQDRVVIRGECNASDLQELGGPGVLIISDCEGCELDLFRPDVAPALAQSTALVEMHDFVDPTISQTLLSRFAKTHRAVVINSDPVKDAGPWEALRGLSATDQALAIDEQRPLNPYPMQWAVLRPR